MSVAKYFVLSLVSMLSTCLWGDLEQHLKKIEYKCPEHTMPNIDYIYMINLDQRPENWHRSVNQLAPFGIDPYRFSAVNGWELSLETINDVGVKFSPGMEGGFMATTYLLDGNFEQHHEIIQDYGRTYFCHYMGRGAIGSALSHISVLQDAMDSGYETIWVMQDDIDVKRDPRVLSELIEKLDHLVGKEGWDILFTDRDIRDGNGNYVPANGVAKRPDFVPKNDFYNRTDISSDFRRIGARYGTHSMIMRRQGIKKLLQFFKAHQIYLPYDLDIPLPNGMNFFTVREDVVANLPGGHS